MQQVRIYDGKLSTELFLEYQLYQNGQPVDFNYRGEAAVNGSSLVIFQTTCSSLEYEIAKFATVESTEWSNGYYHGLAQKRRREPSTNKSQKFYNGWYAAWQQKKES